MYMRGHNPNQLDGFNPLKAIGRALGSTGRAIVGAIVPGVGTALQNTLDTAAKMPAGNATGITAAAATALPATATANVPTASGQDALNKSVVDLIGTLVAKQNTAQPGAPVVVNTPSGGGGGPVYIPAPAAASAPLPSWAIPAAIGAAALLFVSQRKGR